MSGGKLRQVVARIGWNVADQIVSSGTNLALSVLVARSLSVDGFGAFAVAFTVYSFLIGASRSLIGQPLVVRFASRSDVVFRSAAQSAAGAAADVHADPGVELRQATVDGRHRLGAALRRVGERHRRPERREGDRDPGTASVERAVAAYQRTTGRGRWCA